MKKPASYIIITTKTAKKGLQNFTEKHFRFI